MKDLLTELQNTKAELLQAISTIDEDKLNIVPYQDGWTAAQVSEHILKAVGVTTLYGKTHATDRDPQEKVKATADLFLNLDIKMQSPDFIYPSDKKYTKDELIHLIADKFTKLIKAAEELDLSSTCLAFEIPGFGPFTRLEFVWFYVFHTQRHIFQLKKVAKALAE
jgi:hypothetical protein